MRFTIAITVYKSPEFLPRAVQTVLSQTVDDWEMLVYSDGRSTVAEQVVGEVEDLGRVHYRRHRRRRGSYGNRLRRLALEEGRGDYVCYLGHDCLLYPTYLETHAATLDAAPEALSLVRVAYWKNTVRRGTYPVGDDLMALGEGEFDLMCLAFPRRLALEVGCFDAEMESIRSADYISFDRLRRHATPILSDAPEQGAHF
ncbi:MAG: glycosyltransferase family A protein [Thermoanaerobaculia bacterium]|nr:glycosyltransferase family A protein [Thermoanaerobaculia bacterium]